MPLLAHLLSALLLSKPPEYRLREDVLFSIGTGKAKLAFRFKLPRIESYEAGISDVDLDNAADPACHDAVIADREVEEEGGPFAGKRYTGEEGGRREVDV